MKIEFRAGFRVGIRYRKSHKKVKERFRSIKKLKVILKGERNVEETYIIVHYMIIHIHYSPVLNYCLTLINRAVGLYGRILTEVVSTDRTQ